eukprot:gene9359-9522_t
MPDPRVSDLRQDQHSSDTASQPGPPAVPHQRQPQHAGAQGRLAINIEQQQHVPLQRAGSSSSPADIVLAGGAPSDLAQDTRVPLPAPRSAVCDNADDSHRGSDLLLSAAGTAAAASPADLLLPATGGVPGLDTAASGSASPTAPTTLEKVAELAVGAAATGVDEQLARPTQHVPDQQQEQTMEVDDENDENDENDGYAAQNGQIGLELLGNNEARLTDYPPSPSPSPSRCPAALTDLD